MQDSVTLEHVLLPHDLSLIKDWLQRPHVQKWWGDPNDRLEQLQTTPNHEHALIVVKGKPVGYMRWQTVVREDLEAVDLTEIPDGAIDIDMFIGVPAAIGQGYGPNALQLLVARLKRIGHIPLLGLCTSIENTAAIRAFEKVGFKRMRQFEAPGYGQCWVLTMTLET